MADNKPHFDPESESRFARPNAVRDILIVGCPIVLLGVFGNVVGLSTLGGGAIINLGYVLMIVLGGLILNCQRSSWREIGLRRPRSLRKTILFGFAAFVAALTVFVAAQVVAMSLLAILGHVPAEIDQSRFNALEGNLPFFILTIVLSWTTIAFGEEMFYRSFLITRMINSTTIKPGMAVLIAGAGQQAEKKAGVVLVKRPHSLGDDLAACRHRHVMAFGDSLRISRCAATGC